jgi:hypothetical protein
LASFFRLQPDGSAADSKTSEPDDPVDGTAIIAATAPVAANNSPGLAEVLSELTLLRAQVGDLSEIKSQLAVLATQLGPGAPTAAAPNDDR